MFILDLEPVLIRNAHNMQGLSERLNIKSSEIRSLIRGTTRSCKIARIARTDENERIVQSITV